MYVHEYNFIMTDSDVIVTFMISFYQYRVEKLFG